MTFDSFVSLLNIDFSQLNVKLAIMIIISIFVIAFIFRIVIWVTYSGKLTSLRLFSKTISKKDDIKPTHSKFLNKAIKSYITSCEKGVIDLNIDIIAKKSVSEIHLIGISMISVENFCKSIELILPVTILSVVLVFQSIGWIVIFVFIYIIYRVAFFIFSVESVKEKIQIELMDYLNKEIGQFYTKRNKDISSDSTDMLEETLQGYSTDIIEKIGEAYKNNITEISKVIANEFKNELLDIMKDYANFSNTHNITQASEIDYNAINSTLAFVQKNQIALDESLQNYECSVKSIISKAGDALTNIVDFESKRATSNIRETAENSIKDYNITSKESFEKLALILESIYEQNKSHIQTSVMIKEQLEKNNILLKNENS